jgi:hypothetical protein
MKSAEYLFFDPINLSLIDENLFYLLCFNEYFSQILFCRYFTFLEQCKDPKACTILLRGGSKDVLNEIERNLQDAMQVQVIDRVANLAPHP